MNQKSFINELQTRLIFLPKERVKDIVSDYEEHFAEGLSKGLSEEQIAQRLGQPKTIAKQYKIKDLLGDESTPITIGKVLRVLYIGLSLAFFNILFVAGLYIGLLGTYFASVITNIALIMTGLFVIVLAVFPTLTTVPWLETQSGPIRLDLLPIDRTMLFLLATGFVSLFLITFIGLMIVGKWIAKGTVTYIRSNVSIITRLGGQTIG
jgi:uncharacterized membrane protein